MSPLSGHRRRDEDEGKRPDKGPFPTHTLAPAHTMENCREPLMPLLAPTNTVKPCPELPVHLLAPTGAAEAYLRFPTMYLLVPDSTTNTCPDILFTYLHWTCLTWCSCPPVNMGGEHPDSLPKPMMAFTHLSCKEPLEGSVMSVERLRH